MTILISTGRALEAARRGGGEAIMDAGQLLFIAIVTVILLGGMLWAYSDDD